MGVIGNLMPVFNIDIAFLNNFDTSTAIVIDMISKAAYFFPFDTFIDCMAVLFAFKNYKYVVGIFKWVITLVRGGQGV
jgi:hypothetical protein